MRYIVRNNKLMDEKAFITIIPHLREVAVNSSRRTGASTSEAEDVAQEVSIRLWQMRDKLPAIKSLEAFTATVAHNMTISMYRSNHPKSPESVLNTLHDFAASPQEQVEWHENEQWLESRLQQLPSTQHTVLYMRQVQMMSFHDIAIRLGIAETSVRSLLSRARKSLLDDIKMRNKL